MELVKCLKTQYGENTPICFEDIAEKIDIMFKGKPYWELNHSIRIEE